MTQSNTTGHETQSENMQDSPMMAHLLDALKQGTDIGHYGRLTFVMIARHFLPEDEIVELLSHQPDHNATEARALLHQVKARDYNPLLSANVFSNGSRSKIFPSVQRPMIQVHAMSIRNCASLMASTRTSANSMRNKPRPKRKNNIKNLGCCTDVGATPQIFY